jgi:transposase-like zinc ribbon protein/ISXO2 transposase-like protein
MARQKQPKAVDQMTAAQFDALLRTEEDCTEYLIVRRWPQGVICPRCGNPKVYPLASGHHWQCTQCAPGGSAGYRFSHLAGTIFENTNKPLKDWFRVIHLMLVSKKGMSALQIYRYMGFGSYETAWLMCHKVRVALTEDIHKLGGIVEVDETLVGGDAHNRHKDKRDNDRMDGSRGGGKSIVVGAVRRKGNVVACVIANVQGDALTSFVREAVFQRG